MQAEKREAVIYCRIATANDFALENQQRILHGFAASKGFDVTAEYLDNGASGLTFDRPAFSQMDKDMIAGKIHTIIVLNASRIGRESFAVSKWLDKVRALGVEVVSERDDLEACEMLFSLLNEFSKRK